MMTNDADEPIAHTECYDNLAVVDMHTIDTGDRQVAVVVMSVNAAEAEAIRADIKTRLDAGQPALASQLDALGLRTAVEAWARR
jgi:predicted deacylase